MVVGGGGGGGEPNGSGENRIMLERSLHLVSSIVKCTRILFLHLYVCAFGCSTNLFLVML